MFRLLKRQLRRSLERRGFVQLHRGGAGPGFLADLTEDEKATIEATAGRTMLLPHKVDA